MIEVEKYQLFSKYVIFDIFKINNYKKAYLQIEYG